MGNRLNQVKNAETGEDLVAPELWLQHIVIDFFDEFKGHYNNLETHLQAKIIDIARGKEIFADQEKAKEWFDKIKENPEEMKKLKKGAERVLRKTVKKTIIEDQQKKLDKLTENIKDLNLEIEAKEKEKTQRGAVGKAMKGKIDQLKKCVSCDNKEELQTVCPPCTDKKSTPKAKSVQSIKSDKLTAAKRAANKNNRFNLCKKFNLNQKCKYMCKKC